MLGVAAAVAVGTAIAVTLLDHPAAAPKHKAIAGYITSVDRIQQRLQTELTKTVRAYRDFATRGRPAGNITAQLAEAERTFRSLERQIVALPAPAPAHHLRALLIELTGAEASTAQEVSQLSVFAPAYSASLRRASAAAAALTKGLAGVRPPTAHEIHGTRRQVRKAQAAFATAAAAAAAKQAAAVDSYDAAIGGVLRALHRLDPPAVMAPALHAQLRTLAASERAGGALAHELRAKDRSRVAVFGRKFTLAARIAGSVSAQKAEIAAVKAYNRRVRAIGAVQGEIRRELARLQSLHG